MQFTKNTEPKVAKGALLLINNANESESKRQSVVSYEMRSARRAETRAVSHARCVKFVRSWFRGYHRMLRIAATTR